MQILAKVSILEDTVDPDKLASGETILTGSSVLPMNENICFQLECLWIFFCLDKVCFFCYCIVTF